MEKVDQVENVTDISLEIFAAGQMCEGNKDLMQWKVFRMFPV